MSESSPGADVPPREAKSPRWLLALAGALVVVPVFAMGWWRDGSEIALVLYRQPKAAAISILGWLFLTAFLASRIRSSHWAPLAAPSRLVEVRLLAAFLGWMALTLLWVEVPANALVELQQYLLLTLLLLVLVAWQWQEPGVVRVLRGSLLSALAVATLFGGLQLLVDVPWLQPINPVIGAPHPSFLGYKNPMALALLGQLFLLAEAAFVGRGPRAWLWRWVLVLELAYLASLGSRTALAATAVAILWCTTWTVARALSQGGRTARLRRGLAWGALAAGLFVALVASHPVGRAKAASVLGFVASPSSYLESDRGIYLRNTLEMVRHHPLGVGLGDWQTHYPVYRRHGREVAFTDTHQVRRAHSDPVQFLGEGGWPGLGLWLVFLGVVVGRQTLQFWKTGASTALLGSTQMVAFAAAMATDYLIEMPYGKFQFFLVLALCLGAIPPAGDSPAEEAEDDAPRDRKILVAATLVMALALVTHGLRQSQTLRRTVAGAALQQGYQAWSSGRAGGAALLLRRLEEHGETFLDTPGVTKTTHRDFLVLAHAQALLGRREVAITLAERCLELHPHYPPAYELMAQLAQDPEVAGTWRRAHHQLVAEAFQGFEAPETPPLSSPPE